MYALCVFYVHTMQYMFYASCMYYAIDTQGLSPAEVSQPQHFYPAWSPPHRLSVRSLTQDFELPQVPSQELRLAH